MHSALREAVERYCISLLLLILAFAVPATAQTSSPQPSPQAGPAQTGADAEDPLDNPVLLEADADRSITYLKSRVALEYTWTQFYDNSYSNKLKIKGQQAFGHKHRWGIAYELPFAVYTATNQANYTGVGDLAITGGGIISKSEHFTQGAAVKFTFQTASNNKVGGFSTDYKLYYGFAVPVGHKMLLTTTLAYIDSISVRYDAYRNQRFEPEFVLSRVLGKGAAIYLDWDTYYQFTLDDFGQTLKTGLSFDLNSRNKWNLSPYVEFPLNNFTTRTNEKRAFGFALTYYY